LAGIVDSGFLFYLIHDGGFGVGGGGGAEGHVVVYGVHVCEFLRRRGGGISDQLWNLEPNVEL